MNIFVCKKKRSSYVGKNKYIDPILFIIYIDVFCTHLYLQTVRFKAAGDLGSIFSFFLLLSCSLFGGTVWAVIFEFRTNLNFLTFLKIKQNIKKIDWFIFCPTLLFCQKQGLTKKDIFLLICHFYCLILSHFGQK